MKNTKPLALFFLFLSILCAGIGCIDQLWITLIGSAAVLVFGYFTRKQTNWVPSSVILVVILLLAVMGLTNDGLPYLLICGAAFALVAWDLWLKQPKNSDFSGKEASRYLAILAVSVGSGLFLAMVGTQIPFHLPFGILILLIVFLYFSLERSFHYFKRF